jgi:energy-coupling factor transporter ATP-binding protein EcfA2
MQITLTDVRVDGRREPMLEDLDLTWSTGECVLVAGEPGHGHTALALVATGRFQPSAGQVRLAAGDDAPAGRRAGRTARASGRATLRDVTAVVDVPGISEPDEALTVADVVAEGLALAGRRSLPTDVSRWLVDHSLTADRSRRIDQVPGVVRTALLAALAAENADVRFLVLTLPDRHGGEPSGWWEVAQTLAASGLGVLVQCTRASARDLGADLPPARGASIHQPPVVVLRTRPVPPPGADPDPAPLPSGPDPEPAEPADTETTPEEDR